jgi:hypothetical protein
VRRTKPQHASHGQKVPISTPMPWSTCGN